MRTHGIEGIEEGIENRIEVGKGSEIKYESEQDKQGKEAGMK